MPPAATRTTCQPVAVKTTTLPAARVPTFSSLAATCSHPHHSSAAVQRQTCAGPSELRTPAGALRADAQYAAEYLGGLCCGFPGHCAAQDKGLPACSAVVAHRHEGLVATCQVRTAVAQCREAVAQGRVPWAAVVAQGFADDPSAWSGADADFADGRLAGRAQRCDESAAVALLLPGGGVCVLACAAANSGFRRLW